jgi:hypothetical protein
MREISRGHEPPSPLTIQLGAAAPGIGAPATRSRPGEAHPPDRPSRSRPFGPGPRAGSHGGRFRTRVLDGARVRCPPCRVAPVVLSAGRSRASCEDRDRALHGKQVSGPLPRRGVRIIAPGSGRRAGSRPRLPGRPVRRKQGLRSYRTPNGRVDAGCVYPHTPSVSARTPPLATARRSARPRSGLARGAPPVPGPVASRAPRRVLLPVRRAARGGPARWWTIHRRRIGPGPKGRRPPGVLRRAPSPAVFDADFAAAVRSDDARGSVGGRGPARRPDHLERRRAMRSRRRDALDPGSPRSMSPRGAGAVDVGQLLGGPDEQGWHRRLAHATLTRLPWRRVLTHAVVRACLGDLVPHRVDGFSDVILSRLRGIAVSAAWRHPAAAVHRNAPTSEAFAGPGTRGCTEGDTADVSMHPCSRDAPAVPTPSAPAVARPAVDDVFHVEHRSRCLDGWAAEAAQPDRLESDSPTPPRRPSPSRRAGDVTVET